MIFLGEFGLTKMTEWAAKSGESSILKLLIRDTTFNE